MEKFIFAFTLLCAPLVALCSKPLVIAHRGASGYLPEQTMEAKVMAYMMNTDYIELDVILSKDDQLIVTHDLILDEISNVREVFPADRARQDSHYYVIDFTYDELKQLNVTERFTNWTHLSNQKYPNRFPLWKSNFHLHSFAEEIELLEGLHKTYRLKNSDNSFKNVSFLIEIKRPYFHSINGKPNLSKILLDLLDKHGLNTDKSLIILQSFDPFELAHIKHELKSPLRLVQLLLKNSDLDYPEEIGRIDYDYWNSPAGLRNISTFAVGIAAEKSLLANNDNPRNVFKPTDMYNLAREMKMSVFAWTFRLDQLPPNYKSFTALLDVFTKTVKLDGLITDFPADVIAYLSTSQNSHTTKLASSLICILSGLLLHLLQ